MTPEDKDKITDDILQAFDSMAEEGAEESGIGEGVSEPEPEPSSPEEDNPEEQPEDEPGTEEPAESEEPEEIEVRAEGEPGDEQPEQPAAEEGEREEEEAVHEAQYSPEIQAFIDRHGGDLEKTLQTAVEIQRMLGDRNREHGELTRRVTQLEAELTQAQALSPSTLGLTPEQAEWVASAIESEQPGAYIQSAVAAGEFDLARAVCDAWGQEGDAYQALRTRQMVDEAENASRQAQIATEPPPVISREDLYGMIQEQVPDFGDYWTEMTEVVTQLGKNHPMVLAANSQDPNEAALGLIDIYQVARTRKARVSEARQQVEAEQRERGVAARQQARVSSASTRTSTQEPPRPVQIAPGLTLEELDAALAAE